MPLHGVENAKESYWGPAERQFRKAEAIRPDFASQLNTKLDNIHGIDWETISKAECIEIVPSLIKIDLPDHPEKYVGNIPITVTSKDKYSIRMLKQKLTVSGGIQCFYRISYIGVREYKTTSDTEHLWVNIYSPDQVK